MDNNAVNFFTGFTICIGMLVVFIELVAMCFIGLFSRKERNMLVLRRKVEQSILIGEDIKIIILGVEDGVVKIGIEAPKNVNIVRSELLEEKQEVQNV